MNGETPQVFVSHATEDQQDYAEPLARRLYERSVQAWYSEWEITGGDSIVQRIFEEGIKQADAFVIILSKSSVVKPWVKAELDVAVVNNIEKSTRLIPVKVDDCEVPESLRAKHYFAMDKYKSIEAIANAIADTILGNVKTPPLGKSPAFIQRTSIRIPGLRTIDSRVTELAYGIAFEANSDFIQTYQIREKGEIEGMTREQVKESIDVLLDHGWFEPISSRNSGAIRLSNSALIPIAIEKQHVSPQIDREIGAYVYSNISGDHQLECDELPNQFPIKRFLIDAILQRLHDQGFFGWSQPLGPTLGTVFTPATNFKRWLEEE